MLSLHSILEKFYEYELAALGHIASQQTLDFLDLRL